MPDKFKKIEKRFVLSDSSINVYDFRLLSEGYMMNEYLKNPIGYYMHDRSTGVLVRWEEIKREDDKITGIPVINLSHPRGQQTVDEIESGFLNAASVGEIVVLDSRIDYLNGEQVMTVTQWYNKECSLVDRGGNRNAIATKLYDMEGAEIPDLTDFTHQNEQLKMKNIPITPVLVAMLNLADNAGEAEIISALQNLADQAKLVAPLQQKNTLLTAQKDKAVQDLADYKTENCRKEIRNLLDTAMAEKRLAKGLADNLEQDYAGKPEALKVILAGMAPYQPLVTNLTDKASTQLKNLMDLSWEELDKGGKLQNLKDLSFDSFKEKFKDRFGKEYAALS